MVQSLSKNQSFSNLKIKKCWSVFMKMRIVDDRDTSVLMEVNFMILPLKQALDLVSYTLYAFNEVSTAVKEESFECCKVSFFPMIVDIDTSIAMLQCLVLRIRWNNGWLFKRRRSIFSLIRDLDLSLLLFRHLCRIYICFVWILEVLN